MGALRIRCFVCILLCLSAATFALDEFVGPFSNWANAKTNFGAKGDGVTDDADSLQNALNSLGLRTGVTAEGVLYLPAGTYRITRPLDVPRHSATVPPVTQKCRIVGEDPTKVTILWDGAVDTFMVWADGAPWTSWERITWDGNNKAGTCFKQMWSRTYGQASTFVMHIDEVFTNAKYGLRCPNLGNHQMDAEEYIERCKFINCSVAGIYTASANSQNWSVWYSEFRNCGLGVWVDGYREVYVYNCNMYNSTVADFAGVNSVRGCYSSGSKAFTKATSHSIEDQRSYYFNTIVNTTDAISIDEGTYGCQLYVVDNVIVSRAGVTGPVVRHQTGHTVCLGNTFTAASPIWVWLFCMNGLPLDRV